MLTDDFISVIVKLMKRKGDMHGNIFTNIRLAIERF